PQDDDHARAGAGRRDADHAADAHRHDRDDGHGMRVAVLSGGRSSEHKVSLASGGAVRSGLAEAGHDVLDVRVGRDGAWSLDGEPAALDGLGLPVFVKPARLGSSVGIAKVAERGELDGALRTAFDHDPLVIVEAMAPGIEVECSVLGDTEPQASEPGEITYASDWYDYAAKYTPGG